MLGIIGAMDEEVAKVKEEMTQVQVIKAAGMDYAEFEAQAIRHSVNLILEMAKCMNQR